MRAYLFFIILLLSVLLPLTSVSADPAAEQAEAIKIQEAILNRDYSKAKELLNSIAMDPDSVMPSLIGMTIAQVRMFENFTFDREGEFLQHSQSNVALCEPRLAVETTASWTLKLCSAGDALRAFHFIKSHQTFKALTYANRALDALKRVKTQEPDDVDVDLGFAMYDYFKSEFTETALAFVPFFKDKRDEALARIRTVSAHGVYARHLADFALAMIALDSHRQDVGTVIFPKLLAKFPGSMLFRIMNSAFLIKTRKYEAARLVLDEIDRRAPEITVTKYFRGRSLVLEGKDFDDAEILLGEYLQTRGDASVKGPTHYLLGVIAERRGEREQALSHYKTAYDLFPRYRASLKALLRLRNAK